MSQTSSTIDLTVSDVSQQKVRKIDDVAPDVTASELVEALIKDLNLSRNDAEGRSYFYRAFLQRERRPLHPTERVGDSLESGDWIVLQPNVEAG